MIEIAQHKMHPSALIFSAGTLTLSKVANATPAVEYDALDGFDGDAFAVLQKEYSETNIGTTGDGD